MSVASLVLDRPHGLLVQSYSPRRQKHGLMNADGWGVGFFDGRYARRWRSAAPLWGDASFASVAPALRERLRRGRGAVGHRRHAHRTVGVGTVHRRRAGCCRTTGVVDRAVLPQSAAAESTVDSALLAALIFERGLDELGDTVVEVGAADPNARLNILAANGSRMLATTWGDTLSVLRRDDGVVLASEPYDDDPGWQEVPDRHLVEVDDNGVTFTPLEGRS